MCDLNLNFQPFVSFTFNHKCKTTLIHDSSYLLAGHTGDPDIMTTLLKRPVLRGLTMW